jgi:polyphosphate kinase
VPARIVARMNSLVDEQVIEALYRASQAGVKVDLIVRGICCLRPGVKGLSANITVRSVVDRFLEHSRVWCFENACQPQVFFSSADWMPRNFQRRIEVALPIEDGVLADRILNSILAATLADNVKARLLQPDGSWKRARLARLEHARRSQFQFIAQALADEPEQQRRKRRTTRYPEMKLAARPATLDAARARAAKGARR